MLKIKNLSFSFGEKLVINNFSLNVKKGEKIWLSGPSGIGKTTLIKLILGLLKANSGEIDLGGMIPSVVFQENRLLPFYTVMQNIELVGGDKQKAKEILLALGIGETVNLYPKKLSGGMKRRAAIARALSVDFDLLILDEPFNGIDEKNLEKTAELINEICSSKTVIIITHSPLEAELLKAKEVKINN
jgi:ABC-type multidrug transport system ATPase subunit